nr:response regulator transcription factor [Clostridia bacterium]
MKNRFIDCDIVTAVGPNEIFNSDLRFDLVFLDIQMGEIDGISLAKKLKERNNKVVLFFITNYDEYQDDAMDLHAFRYFSKPFDLMRLYYGLDKAMEYIDGAYIDLYLYGDNAQQRVLVDDILYITRNMRKVFLITNLQEFRLREEFDEFCRKLPIRFFYQVHKSFFINLHYVERYSYSEVYLTDGTRIPVAPRKQSAFHKYWFEYLKGR